MPILFEQISTAEYCKNGREWNTFHLILSRVIEILATNSSEELGWNLQGILRTIGQRMQNIALYLYNINHTFI